MTEKRQPWKSTDEWPRPAWVRGVSRTIRHHAAPSATASFALVMAATAMGALFVLSIASLQHYSFVSRSADERIARSLDIAIEHTNKVFEEIELLFSSVEGITRRRSVEALKSEEHALHERLHEMIGKVSDLRAIWLFDRNGRPVVTSSVSRAPDLDNSDRDYFVAQRNPETGTFVGKILIPRIGGPPFFSVSKKWRDETGAVAGISAVVVPPSAFEKFFATLGGGAAASFAIIRDDGAVLARYPAPTAPDIVLAENTGFRRAIAAQERKATYTTVSAVDGLKRRFEVRHLGHLPIYVTSSLEEMSIWREWGEWLLLQLAFGIPTLALILWLEYLALRRTNQFYAEVRKRESAEAVIRQSQKLEAIGQLTGGIAHDFNNLLSIVMGNLEAIVRRTPEEDKTHRQARNALTGAERAAQLVRKLLAFSRRQPLAPKPIDVNQVMIQVAGLLARSLGEKVKIDVFRAPDLWITDVDPIELEASLINLAINARDSMPDGGRLMIEARNSVLDSDYCAGIENLSPGEYVAVSVSDQGTGIPAEVLERVFEPFFTTKAPGSGSGLGLSQVYGFARQSSGHVDIRTEAGKGTTVTLYLPRSNAAKPVFLDEPNRSVLDGRGEKILVVEDDRAVREHLLEMLGDMNYSVLAADNAEAALKLIADPEQRIDLLLTDVVMPGMNGRQLVDLALSERPALQVLFMTGYERDAIVQDGRLHPDVVLIQKPFSQPELSLRLRSMLDTRQTHTHGT
ncbi:hybrid sensor histidine kinase/response regulator [Bradyrhizobium glycinis]|uniref:hybrid sensor histidine kinase/response regulator n=1 Tax=Bradyrhizobium glycinis TaxID=2751812 RepID=UPI0018D70A4E|nr:hybrid sensor histidine kinase/response regulator [Bradyrhizobium glycinis]MBH5370558.1 response regulator [Bradyrhizobium glycinis]